MRHNDANKMIPLLYVLFPEFRQNRNILCNTNVVWGRGLLRRGLIFCINSIRFRGSFNSWGSRIHQSKSWYYLGPFQTSKVELFAKIVFGCKPLTFFCKELKLKCFTSSILFPHCFVSENFASWKKARDICTHIFQFTYTREDMIDWKGNGRAKR